MNQEGAGGWLLPASLVLGVLSVHLYPVTPPDWLTLLCGVAGLVLVVSHKTRLPAFFLLAACWTLWQCQLRLDDRLDPERHGEVAVLSGLVSSIPEQYTNYMRFRFQPDSESQGTSAWPDTLLVYWHRSWPALAAGERWRLELKLKPTWGRVNFQGPDRERWMFSEDIGAVASVHSGAKLAKGTAGQMSLLQFRARVGETVESLASNVRGQGVVKALAIADRSGMPSSDRDILSATGTAHLLAISGLHIGLAAVMGFWLARLMLFPWPAVRRSASELRLSLAGGLLAALAYAALAGFGISTQRALIMLTVMSIALWSHLSIHPLRAWLLALTAVLLFDPLAPLAAGTWFSFSAVAALFLMFAPRSGGMSWWKTLLLAQAGIVLAGLPLNLYWFQFVSPSGFLANLFAIPWVSFIIVPLTLLGILAIPIATGLAAFLLETAALASEGLLTALGLIASWQGPAPVLSPPGLPAAMLAALGGLMLLLPRGMPGRWLGLFMWLPLLIPPDARTASGSLRVDVLDVGQGLAVLVSTPEQTLLYDSGPGDGQLAGLAGSVITPALGRLGAAAPDRIIVSHGDLDHAGGLGQLSLRYPQTPMHLNLAPAKRAERDCVEPLAWAWKEARFRVLHPSPALPYLGNDSSCVVSVSSHDAGEPAAVLLSGDISRVVEERLVRGGMEPHRLLVVPHHGSNTSSSDPFIQAVQPRHAIAASGRGNRFGFPRPDVIRRYEATGAVFWSTGSCGAISVTLRSDGSMQASSARRRRRGMWRWPAGEECP